MQLDIGSEPNSRFSYVMWHALIWTLERFTHWKYTNPANRRKLLHANVTSYVDYYIIQSDFWSSPDRRADGRTDRKRRIWAHHAKCTEELKNEICCTHAETNCHHYNAICSGKCIVGVPLCSGISEMNLNFGVPRSQTNFSFQYLITQWKAKTFLHT